jgi:hypothetical protein
MSPLTHSLDPAIERYRGWRGGIIPMHRAFTRVELSARVAVGNVLLALFWTIVWCFSLQWIAQMWARVFAYWSHLFRWDAAVVMVPQEFSRYVHFSVPYVTVSAGPAGIAYWVMSVLSLLALATSPFLTGRALPWAYLLRAVAIIQLTATAYFAVAAARFPHDLSGYTVSMLVFSMIFIGLVPLILAFTYYLFDFTWWRKLALMVIIMGYLSVFVPMQYMLHVYVLHVSIIFMPVLYFAFGPFLDVLIFICLYSWGMSWQRSTDERLRVN